MSINNALTDTLAQLLREAPGFSIDIAEATGVPCQAVEASLQQLIGEGLAERVDDISGTWYRWGGTV